jgi:hypothetical protein
MAYQAIRSHPLLYIAEWTIPRMFPLDIFSVHFIAPWTLSHLSLSHLYVKMGEPPNYRLSLVLHLCLIVYAPSLGMPTLCFFFTGLCVFYK